MPILENERDAPERVRARAAQEDPWVMYLVVQQELPAAKPALLVAAAQATIRCAEMFAATEAHGEAFRAWTERSFRKVTLRARDSAWTKLGAYDAGAGSLGECEVVRALPPRLRSQCDPFLRGLQVYNPDPAALPPGETVETGGPAMTFVLRPGLTMSVGKQISQVAHAVLMCAWSPLADDPRYREGFAAWRAAGYPGRITSATEWDRARATADGVVVRDAGLTEVDPGTETVLALPPGYAL